jgi:alpha-methylacyl-CoA racemase
MMDGSCPFATSYRTADDKYVVIAAIEPKFYAILLRVLGLDEEALPAQYDSSSWPFLRERFAAAIRTRTRDAWGEAADGLDACLTPVLDFGEATRHASRDCGDAAALLQRWGMDAAAVAAWKLERDDAGNR